MRWILGILIVLVSALEAKVLHLKTNQVLQGEVIEHFVEGIFFKRWDNGGVIQLSWDHLQKADAEKLKQEFGYVLKDETLVTRQASRVFLKNGSFVEGRIAGEYPKDPKIQIRNATTNLVLSREDIHRITAVEMNILDLYTADEIYKDYVSKHNLTTAYAEFEFAEFLRNLQLYEWAIKHYKQAQEKDRTYEIKVKALIDNLEILLKDQELQKNLSSVYSKIKQDKFADAFSRIEDLKKYYESNEPALSLLAKAKEDTEKKRDQFLKEKVPFAYYQIIRTLIRTKGFDRKVGLSDARTYADGELAKEVLQKLSKRYGIEEELIEKTFEERPLMNNKKASYNSGTFIQGLGEGATAADNAKGNTSVEQQIAEFLQSQGGKGKKRQTSGSESSGESDKLQTPDEWWNSSNGTGRYQWLLAYHGEHQMKMQGYYFTLCSNCAGKGFLLITAPDGQFKKTCKRCHGLKQDQGVLFK
ncbi:MAG: hypothetical protein AABZ60_16780 [Planctomycetota bacterium]